MIEIHEARRGAVDRELFGITRPHARLADGRTVIWCNALADYNPIALDAESIDTPIPTHIGRHIAGEQQHECLAAWTSLEVLAKLTDTPILLLLKDIDPTHQAQIVTTSVNDVILSLGRLHVNASASDRARCRDGVAVAEPSGCSGNVGKYRSNLAK